MPDNFSSEYPDATDDSWQSDESNIQDDDQTIDAGPADSEIREKLTQFIQKLESNIQELDDDMQTLYLSHASSINERENNVEKKITALSKEFSLIKAVFASEQYQDKFAEEEEKFSKLNEDFIRLKNGYEEAKQTLLELVEREKLDKQENKKLREKYANKWQNLNEDNRLLFKELHDFIEELMESVHEFEQTAQAKDINDLIVSLKLYLQSVINNLAKLKDWDISSFESAVAARLQEGLLEFTKEREDVENIKGDLVTARQKLTNLKRFLQKSKISVGHDPESAETKKSTSADVNSQVEERVKVHQAVTLIQQTTRRQKHDATRNSIEKNSYTAAEIERIAKIVEEESYAFMKSLFETYDIEIDFENEVQPDFVSPATPSLVDELNVSYESIQNTSEIKEPDAQFDLPAEEVLLSKDVNQESENVQEPQQLDISYTDITAQTQTSEENLYERTGSVAGHEFDAKTMGSVTLVSDVQKINTANNIPEDNIVQVSTDQAVDSDQLKVNAGRGEQNAAALQISLPERRVRSEMNRESNDALAQTGRLTPAQAHAHANSDFYKEKIEDKAAVINERKQPRPSIDVNTVIKDIENKLKVSFIKRVFYFVCFRGLTNKKTEAVNTLKDILLAKAANSLNPSEPGKTVKAVVEEWKVEEANKNSVEVLSHKRGFLSSNKKTTHTKMLEDLEEIDAVLIRGPSPARK